MIQTNARAAIFVSAAWVIAAVRPLTAGQTDPPPIFTPQPSFFSSTINLFLGASFTDDEFVDLLGDTLLDDEGRAKVKNATFLFQQCCSGGILDEIDAKFSSQGDFMPYVAASGAAWNQMTVGPPSRRELLAKGIDPGPHYPANFPDFWTAALLPALNNPTVSIYDAVGAAIIGDPVGTFGPGVRALNIPTNTENGQRITQNGAQPEENPPTFKLRDPDAQSFHALLLAGEVNKDRYLADIGGVYDAIERQWGDPNTNPNVSVSVLFGNGFIDAANNLLPAKWNAKAATKGNLRSELETIEAQLNRNEQFFLYVSDHGGLKQQFDALQFQLIPPGGQNNSAFNFPQEVLDGFADDEDSNTSTMQLDVNVLSSPFPGTSLEVWLNDTMITSVTPRFGNLSITAEVPETMISPSNILNLRNLSNSPVQVTDAFLDGATVNTHTALADDLPNGEVLTIIDNFDQINEFGNPRVAQLSASFAGGQSLDAVDHVNAVTAPVINLTRGMRVQVSPTSPVSNAVATLEVGTKPGVLEMSLSQAETGDAFSGGIFYKLDTPELGIDHRSLSKHPMITLTLAETMTGSAGGQVSILDAMGGFASAPLEQVSSSGGLVWSATINGNTGGTVDTTNATRVGIDFFGVAQSDISILIDSIRIMPVPVPATWLLLTLGCPLLVLRSRGAVGEFPICSGEGRGERIFSVAAK